MYNYIYTIQTYSFFKKTPECITQQMTTINSCKIATNHFITLSAFKNIKLFSLPLNPKVVSLLLQQYNHQTNCLFTDLNRSYVSMSYSVQYQDRRVLLSFFINRHRNPVYGTSHEDIRIVPQTRSLSPLLTATGNRHPKKDHLKNFLQLKCKPLKAGKNRFPRHLHSPHWICLSTAFTGLP